MSGNIFRNGMNWFRADYHLHTIDRISMTRYGEAELRNFSYDELYDSQ